MKLRVGEWVSGGVAALALLCGGVAFGQSITATKAYVDKRVDAVATNTLPARFVPQKGFTLAHYNVTNRVTVGGLMTFTNTATFTKEPQFTGGIYVKNGRYIQVNQIDAAEGSYEVIDVTGTLRMLDPLANILAGVPAADGGYDFVPLGAMVPTHETVTNVARDVSNTFWDEKNQVLWRMAFRDGEPMFLPITNENVSVTGGMQ